MMLILRKIANWFTNNFKVVVISIMSLLVMTIFILNGLLNDKNKEIDRLFNNVRAYELLVDSTKENNRVLLLTINELNNSKDSLLLLLEQTRKKLSIKNKNLQSALVINTVIRDTITKVITTSKDFNETLKLNPLTTIKVYRTDSILTAKIDIVNQLILFIEEKKEYKNKYKNGWIRFWHFDWRKIRVRKYQIHNTNDLIKVTDTRVVEINN